MQVLQHKVEQVPVPGEDGVLHGGEEDDHSTRAGCLASGGQRETGNEEEEISQVGEGQGAHGHVGKGEGASQGGVGGS